MEFIETSCFSRKVHRHLDDEEFADLQVHLMLYPEAGDVIPHSGGIRKIRWKSHGKGKRGGLRIIYFNRLSHGKIWLLDIYAKNQQEYISIEELRILRHEVTND
ncbi:MAG TPA: hypothetical protein VLG38_08215 [Gammaproteobacteria bacterium]|nr:hypothetical protein [Gammaproteobacteria bacterium]